MDDDLCGRGTSKAIDRWKKNESECTRDIEKGGEREREREGGRSTGIEESKRLSRIVLFSLSPPPLLSSPTVSLTLPH